MHSGKNTKMWSAASEAGSDRLDFEKLRSRDDIQKTTVGDRSLQCSKLSRDHSRASRELTEANVSSGTDVSTRTYLQGPKHAIAVNKMADLRTVGSCQVADNNTAGEALSVVVFYVDTIRIVEPALAGIKFAFKLNWILRTGQKVSSPPLEFAEQIGTLSREGDGIIKEESKEISAVAGKSPGCHQAVVGTSPRRSLPAGLQSTNSGAVDIPVKWFSCLEVSGSTSTTKHPLPFVGKMDLVGSQEGDSNEADFQYSPLPPVASKNETNLPSASADESSSVFVYFTATFGDCNECLALATVDLSDLELDGSCKWLSIRLFTTSGPFAEAKVFAASQLRWVVIGQQVFQRYVDSRAKQPIVNFLNPEVDEQATYLAQCVVAGIHKMKYVQSGRGALAEQETSTEYKEAEKFPADARPDAVCGLNLCDEQKSMGPISSSVCGMEAELHSFNHADSVDVDQTQQPPAPHKPPSIKAPTARRALTTEPASRDDGLIDRASPEGTSLETAPLVAPGSEDNSCEGFSLLTEPHAKGNDTSARGTSHSTAPNFSLSDCKPRLCKVSGKEVPSQTKQSAPSEQSTPGQLMLELEDSSSPTAVAIDSETSTLAVAPTAEVPAADDSLKPLTTTTTATSTATGPTISAFGSTGWQPSSLTNPIDELGEPTDEAARAEQLDAFVLTDYKKPYVGAEVKPAAQQLPFLENNCRSEDDGPPGSSKRKESKTHRYDCALPDSFEVRSSEVPRRRDFDDSKELDGLDFEIVGPTRPPEARLPTSAAATVPAEMQQRESRVESWKPSRLSGVDSSYRMPVIETSMLIQGSPLQTAASPNAEASAGTPCCSADGEPETPRSDDWTGSEVPEPQRLAEVVDADDVWSSSSAERLRRDLKSLKYRASTTGGGDFDFEASTLHGVKSTLNDPESCGEPTGRKAMPAMEPLDGQQCTHSGPLLPLGHLSSSCVSPGGSVTRDAAMEVAKVESCVDNDWHSNDLADEVVTLLSRHCRQTKELGGGPASSSFATAQRMDRMCKNYSAKEIANTGRKNVGTPKQKTTDRPSRSRQSRRSQISTSFRKSRSPKTQMALNYTREKGHDSLQDHTVTQATTREDVATVHDKLRDLIRALENLKLQHFSDEYHLQAATESTGATASDELRLRPKFQGENSSSEGGAMQTHQRNREPLSSREIDVAVAALELCVDMCRQLLRVVQTNDSRKKLRELLMEIEALHRWINDPNISFEGLAVDEGTSLRLQEPSDQLPDDATQHRVEKDSKDGRAYGAELPKPVPLAWNQIPNRSSERPQMRNGIRMLEGMREHSSTENNLTEPYHHLNGRSNTDKQVIGARELAVWSCGSTPELCSRPRTCGGLPHGEEVELVAERGFPLASCQPPQTIYEMAKPDDLTTIESPTAEDGAISASDARMISGGLVPLDFIDKSHSTAATIGLSSRLQSTAQSLPNRRRSPAILRGRRNNPLRQTTKNTDPRRTAWESRGVGNNTHNQSDIISAQHVPTPTSFSNHSTAVTEALRGEQKQMVTDLMVDGGQVSPDGRQSDQDQRRRIPDVTTRESDEDQTCRPSWSEPRSAADTLGVETGCGPPPSRWPLPVLDRESNLPRTGLVSDGDDARTRRRRHRQGQSPRTTEPRKLVQERRFRGSSSKVASPKSRFRRADLQSRFDNDCPPISSDYCGSGLEPTSLSKEQGRANWIGDGKFSPKEDRNQSHYSLLKYDFQGRSAGSGGSTPACAQELMRDAAPSSLLERRGSRWAHADSSAKRAPSRQDQRRLGRDLPQQLKCHKQYPVERRPDHWSSGLSDQDYPEQIHGDHWGSCRSRSLVESTDGFQYMYPPEAAVSGSYVLKLDAFRDSVVNDGSHSRSRYQPQQHAKLPGTARLHPQGAPKVQQIPREDIASQESSKLALNCLKRPCADLLVAPVKESGPCFAARSAGRGGGVAVAMDEQRDGNSEGSCSDDGDSDQQRLGNMRCAEGMRNKVPSQLGSDPEVNGESTDPGFCRAPRERDRSKRTAKGGNKTVDLEHRFSEAPQSPNAGSGTFQEAELALESHLDYRDRHVPGIRKIPGSGRQRHEELDNDLDRNLKGDIDPSCDSPASTVTINEVGNYRSYDRRHYARLRRSPHMAIITKNASREAAAESVGHRFGEQALPAEDQPRCSNYSLIDNRSSSSRDSNSIIPQSHITTSTDKSSDGSVGGNECPGPPDSRAAQVSEGNTSSDDESAATGSSEPVATGQISLPRRVLPYQPTRPPVTHCTKHASRGSSMSGSSFASHPAVDSGFDSFRSETSAGGSVAAAWPAAALHDPRAVPAPRCPPSPMWKFSPEFIPSFNALPVLSGRTDAAITKGPSAHGSRQLSAGPPKPTERRGRFARALSASATLTLKGRLATGTGIAASARGSLENFRPLPRFPARRHPNCSGDSASNVPQLIRGGASGAKLEPTFSIALPIEAVVRQHCTGSIGTSARAVTARPSSEDGVAPL